MQDTFLSRLIVNVILLMVRIPEVFPHSGNQTKIICSPEKPSVFVKIEKSNEDSLQGGKSLILDV